MVTWRCPHCRTVQAETARCFLCGRSATSCGTCVNFRSSLVGGVGYCALSRRREPLTGAEQRACWAAVPSIDEGGLFGAPSLPIVEGHPDELLPAPAVVARGISAG